MPNQPKPCNEDEAYANPDDSVDRLGRLFATLRIREKYGITFERYMDLAQRGEWEYFASCAA